MVDPHLFRDTIVVLGMSVLPALFQFLERKFVGGVSIDFVGGHKHENGVGAMLSRNPQQIHSAGRVDIKVVERTTRGQIVARLSGTVNDQIEWAFGPEEAGKLKAVANIQLAVAEITRRFPQPPEIPLCVPFLTEKVSTHVVVYSHDLPGAAVEKRDKFGTDKSTGTGNK